MAVDQILEMFSASEFATGCVKVIDGNMVLYSDLKRMK